MELGFYPTIAILILCLVVIGLARWQQARPVELGRVRMMPWTSVMIFAAFIALLMIVHLVNLGGVETGGGRPGRMF